MFSDIDQPSFVYVDSKDNFVKVPFFLADSRLWPAPFTTCSESLARGENRENRVESGSTRGPARRRLILSRTIELHHRVRICNLYIYSGLT
jgi:hypothetical protein